MIQFAEQPMRPALAAMWRECFGDGNEYVDLYFSNFDITRHTMVFMDGDHPASMLSLLPMTVVTRAGILPARYIYAVATLPSYQGRGLSTKLLEAAHKRMQQAGVKLSVLVPASPKLYNFYGKRGFRTEFYMGVTEVSAGQIPPYRDSFAISEAGCADFMEIRERAFGGRTMFARWDGEALAYRLTETAFAGGETLLLSTQEGRAVAVCYPQREGVLVKELALDGLTLPAALGVLQNKYHAQEYRLRLPMDQQCPYPLRRVPSGAARWYDPEARARTFQTEGGAPYMSLVLD